MTPDVGDDIMNAERPKQHPWLVAAMFVLLAVPGIFLFLGGSLELFGEYCDPNMSSRNPVWPSLAAIAGIVMALVGTGNWRQWRYILVFASVPASLIGFILIDSHAQSGKVVPFVFTAAVAFGVNHLVKASYRGQGELERQPPPGN
jgi:hypothetical protein